MSGPLGGESSCYWASPLDVSSLGGRVFTWWTCLSSLGGCVFTWWTCLSSLGGHVFTWWTCLHLVSLKCSTEWKGTRKRVAPTFDNPPPNKEGVDLLGSWETWLHQCHQNFKFSQVQLEILGHRTHGGCRKLLNTVQRAFLTRYFRQSFFFFFTIFIISHTVFVYCFLNYFSLSLEGKY